MEKDKKSSGTGQKTVQEQKSSKKPTDEEKVDLQVKKLREAIEKVVKGEEKSVNNQIFSGVVKSAVKSFEAKPTIDWKKIGDNIVNFVRLAEPNPESEDYKETVKQFRDDTKKVLLQILPLYLNYELKVRKFEDEEKKAKEKSKDNDSESSEGTN